MTIKQTFYETNFFQSFENHWIPTEKSISNTGMNTKPVLLASCFEEVIKHQKRQQDSLKDKTSMLFI